MKVNKSSALLCNKKRVRVLINWDIESIWNESHTFMVPIKINYSGEQLMEGTLLAVCCNIGNSTFFFDGIFNKRYTLVKFTNKWFQKYSTKIAKEI